MEFIKEMVLIPLRNCGLELSHLIIDNFKYFARYLSLVILSFTLISIAGYYHLAIWYITWILLGIASSIGFGFGMHTFVLFLAPHIAAVTMAAHSCRSLNFPEPPYPNEIICPNDYTSGGQVSFLQILQKIGPEAFMWGLGTAIGELPPYLAARLRAQAMRKNRTGGDHAGENFDGQASDWERWIIQIINKVGFFGILLCAAIPNPLFDAAGVASGMAQVPFISFFGATLIGKSVIKMLLQSSSMILAFHNNNLDLLIEQVDKRLCEYFPSIRDFNLSSTMSKFLQEQRNNVLKKSGGAQEVSWLATIFSWIITACFVLFTISLINALDKQFRERKAREIRRSE